MILYLENPNESTKTLLQLINKFSQVTAYKMNTQKSILLLYSSNENSENEILK